MLKTTQLHGFNAAGLVAVVPPFVNYYDASNISSITKTFYSCSLGPPAANRLVVLAIKATGLSTGQSISTVTIGGVSASRTTPSATPTRHVELWQAVVTSGTTGHVVITASAGSFASIGLGVYAIFPASTVAVDALYASASTANSVTLTDLAKTAGGVSILASSFNASDGRTAVLTFPGETVTEDRENGAVSYVFGSVSVNSSTSTTDDPSVTWSGAAANVAIAGATWA
jgi:hypothetical protein